MRHRGVGSSLRRETGAGFGVCGVIERRGFDGARGDTVIERVALDDVADRRALCGLRRVFAAAWTSLKTTCRLS